MKALVVLSAIVLLLGFTPMLLAGNLWQDNFDDGSLDAAYITPSGGNGAGDPEWVEEGGVAKQIQPKPGDPTYLAVQLDRDINFCGQLARIRFDEWQDHDRSRAGVGFWLDPADKYNGYTTVIHNSLTTGNYQFLNDARGWDGAHIVNFDTGGVDSWFWMRAEIDFGAKTMVGKVWVGDLADEPADWIIETDYTTYGGVRQPTRWVGLNGGAGTGDGFSKVSFDDWFVYDEGGESFAVDSRGKVALCWGSIKK
jgi:hypothetical protein